MDRERAKQDLVSFLRSIQRPDRPIEDLDEDESLVASGLIDSLAIIQIINHVEGTYGVDFLAGGINPSELRSVGSILDIIERHAAP